jgi:putative glycerol-1-phosphate prenyltransferase
LNDSVLTWRHVFKLDPDRTIDDQSLERICLSGTDGIIVGGSTGVTYDNTAQLLMRIRRYPVACILELSNPQAIVPGFDGYVIPMVLNTSNPDWIIGHHQRAIRDYSSILSWQHVLAEGYIILNSNSTVAKVTEADTELDPDDVIAYAQLADCLLHLPIVYLEYSGTFGNMDIVRSVKSALRNARLIYGGGIDSIELAQRALESADTIVVGNLIYDNIDQAILTVQAMID